MKTKLPLIVIAILANIVSFGQNFKWANNVEKSAENTEHSIGTDNEGNVYVTGLKDFQNIQNVR